MSINTVDAPHRVSAELSELPLFDEAGTCEELDNPFPIPACVEPASGSAQWTASVLAELADRFLKQTEPLFVASPVRAWEDDDDLFAGERFEDDEAEPSVSELTVMEKAALLRAVFARQLEGDETDGEVVVQWLGWARFYRTKLLLDPRVSRDDVREVLKRIYTQEEFAWMDDEARLARMVLLSECKIVARAAAAPERKEEIMQWIFAPREFERLPFSFKHCVMECGEPGPGLGQLHERLKEEIQALLPAWREQGVEKKKEVLRRRVERTGQQDLFI